MKKRICLLICMALISFLMTGGICGCSSKTPGLDQPAGINDVLEEAVAGDDSKKPDSADSVDVDLTILSSTMVYAEVYNMMVSPEEYIGKTVKMKGLFACYHDETSGNYYFACVIQDATACCAQGIEFVLTDDYVYPDDYPEVNQEICVVGVFDTYKEGDYTYCTLRNAILHQ